MNRFGNRLAISIFGESHNEIIGVTIDGTPAGMPISENDFINDIARRNPKIAGTTKRKELDTPIICSGTFNEIATGAPITILFKNKDVRTNDYSKIINHPRPSHADLTAHIKYGGHNDHRGGGHFSGRVTIALVAAGVIAKKILLQKKIIITSEIISIGACNDESEFDNYIQNLIKSGDSAGGLIKCTINGVKIGQGEPFFNSIESVISHIIFSIPAIKGIEFGSGFQSAQHLGSFHNDKIINMEGKYSSNNSGGINGGISNGNQITFQVAVKPTPSISITQNTLNMQTNNMEQLIIEGRHDNCIALRMPVIIEAAAAIAMCNIINYKPVFI